MTAVALIPSSAPCVNCGAPATWLALERDFEVSPLCDTCHAERYPDD